MSPGGGGLRTPIDLAFGRNGDLFLNPQIEGPFTTRGAVLRYDRRSGGFLGSFADDPDMGVPRGGMMFVQIVPEPASVTVWSVLGLGGVVSIIIGRLHRTRFRRVDPEW